MKTGKLCELCEEEAFVYCCADGAFLCWNCDNKVHQANFLVARHLRRILCSNCKSFSQFQPIRGILLAPPSQSQYSHRLCKACSFDQDNHSTPSSTLSSSSSSDCLSTNESSSTDFRPKRMLVKYSRSSSRSTTGSTSFSNSNRLEGIFAIWCKKLGLNGHSILPTATSALRFCLERLPVLPLRLGLAASFWMGLRMNAGMSFASWQNLRRLEELSGVPAKLIVAIEPRLTRAMRSRRRIKQE